MRKILILVLFVVLIYKAYTQNFARGADVGWLSEMEQSGRIWRDSMGVQRDLFDILDDYCINSIRLRVWVNPTGGWSGKQDVINLAKRAVAKGYRLMVDFHYSDSWADPGKQTKPAAWATYSVTQLRQAVYDHTYDVLNSLKAQNVPPEWVQVGNETNNGMLWPEGQASTNMANYAAFVSRGYDAVKAVFSNAKVIVHVSNGFDNELFKWNIGGLVSNGAKFDIIGMSMYPETAADWSTYSVQTNTNMKDLVTRYNKSIMISEIGLATNAPSEGKLFVEQVIKNLQALSNNKGLGVFWWEPEAYNWKGYGKVAWNANTTVDAYEATHAMKGFMYGCSKPNVSPTVNLTSPGNNSTYISPAQILLTATASDSDGSIASVSFYNGNNLLFTDNSTPYSYTWNNVGAGEYFVNAKAVDNLGLETISAQIKIIVNSVVLDCNGTPNGSAYIDNCGVCVGGQTGKEPCQPVNVTFKLAMTDTVLYKTAYITGTMTSVGGNWQIIPMLNEGRGVYSSSFSMFPGTQGAFYFLSENVWTARELVPQECVEWYTSDRGYLVGNRDTVIYVTWQSCSNFFDCANSFNGNARIDDCGKCSGGTTGLPSCQTQIIKFDSGWNLFSINLIPDKGTNVDSMFSGLDVVIIKDMNQYWYSSQSQFLNTLQTIKPGFGYFAKVDSPETLIIKGIEANTPDWNSFKQGWNLLGTPFQANVPFSEFFNTSNCQIIKNFDGFWNPNSTMNSIYELESGKAYLIKK